MVLDVNDATDLGPRVVERRRFSQATANSKTGFKYADAARNRAVVVLKELINMDVPDTRVLGLVRERGQLDDLLKFMLALQSENAALSAACVTEKAAHAKSLLDLSAPRGEKAAQKKLIEDLVWRLVEELSMREGSVADKRHTGKVVAAIEKLTDKVKQLSARVDDLEGEVVKGSEAVADHNIKLKAANKWAEDVVYKKQSASSLAAVSKRAGQDW